MTMIFQSMQNTGVSGNQARMHAVHSDWAWRIEVRNSHANSKKIHTLNHIIGV